jgi:hypothetical protein
MRAMGSEAMKTSVTFNQDSLQTNDSHHAIHSAETLFVSFLLFSGCMRYYTQEGYSDPYVGHLARVYFPVRLLPHNFMVPVFVRIEFLLISKLSVDQILVFFLLRRLLLAIHGGASSR